MSHLREIMQRLQARTPTPPTPAPQLEEHLSAYGEHLRHCTDPMLQYEWVWLEQHLESLAMCASQPGMREAAGGATHVAQLLRESECFLPLLRQEMERRGLQPALHRASVVPSEHAWELSHAGIRAAWGLPPLSPP
ncbi:MAG: hypothetical protein ACOVNL_03635 [Prochlorococcaceae cyanobacterium]|jgi:hypothetical protein